MVPVLLEDARRHRRGTLTKTRVWNAQRRRCLTEPYPLHSFKRQAGQPSATFNTSPNLWAPLVLDHACFDGLLLKSRVGICVQSQLQ